MEADLLLKEDEFYKENEKLELRTKQLMQKVNDVMKIQDNLIKETFKTQAEINNARKSSFKVKKPTEEEILFEKHVELEDKDSEEAGTYNTGLCRVLKAKIKSLLAEKERMQIELRQKCEELKKAQKENQLVKEEKEKWFLSYNTSKNNVGKLETQIVNLNARLQSKETENVAMKKELENVKKELKSSNINFNNCDVRLTRACEEIDKFKSIVKQCKDEEKEVKDGYRKQVSELTSTIKRLERQKIELLNGFKKQIQLIEVLKKEKMHLEAIKIIEMSEAEYTKILDWKFE